MISRIPTPVVLASSSAMIVTGALAWWVSRAPEQERIERVQRTARATAPRIDDRTPEAAAESFLDAWRRRAWDEAERLSVGEARARVAQKRAAEAELEPEDREMARRLWEAMASAPLRVSFLQSDDLGGRFALRGVAAYDFVGRPYRRHMEWLVVRQGDVYRVERMVHGRVITPLPDLLDLEGER